MTSRLMSASMFLLTAMLAGSANRTLNAQSTSTLTVHGRIEGAGDTLSLGAPTTGTISQVMVKAGDHVQAGQSLLKVECRDLENEILARQSDLAAAQAVFARVTNGSRPELRNSR